jgi:hypothetical protein
MVKERVEPDFHFFVTLAVFEPGSRLVLLPLLSRK